MQLLPSLLAGLKAICATFPDARKGRGGNIEIADFGLAAFSMFFMQSASFLAYQRALDVAIEQAIGSDRGDVIVSAMIEYLRERRILLPAAVTLEKIALAARALARKRAHKSIAESLSPLTIAGLEALLVVAEGEERTPLAWLREWPEAPRGTSSRSWNELEAVRKLGVGADREKRIHRARYAAIAREKRDRKRAASCPFRRAAPPCPPSFLVPPR